MNTFYMLLLVTFRLMVTFALPFAIVGLIIWRTHRRKKFVSQSLPAPDPTARFAETIAIAGLSVSMMVMLAMYRVYDGIPYAFTDLAPDGAVTDYWTLIGFWSLIVTTGIALAWFRKPVVSVVLLTVFFCGAGYYVNEGLAFSYKAHEAEVRTTKLPLTITIKNDVVGADVWFNEVWIGKTPIVADLDDVLARIPDWSDREKVPKAFTDHKSFLKTKRGSFRPLAWFYLSPATRVTLDDEHEKDRAIYARVELNGHAMFAGNRNRTQSGSRIFGQIRDSHVELDVFLPRWLEDRESLIHRARLANYNVDSAWIAAMESYGDDGWRQIVDLVESEPGFERVLNQWARSRYSIPEQLNESTATGLFDQIRAEADESVSYHTGSITGRAVELLIPHLNRYDVLRTAVRRIESFSAPPPLAVSYQTVAGEFQFGTVGEEDWNGPTLPSDFVLAHAIWRIDQTLDQRDDSQDNMVEREITPALLRLSQNRGTIFDVVGALGGSLFERYVLRHDCRVTVTDETDHNDKTLFIGVNRWMYTAAWLRSPAGTRFRKKNADRLQDMAERIIRESHSFRVNWGGNEIDFLFLDPERGKDSLGYRFYRRFDQIATPDRGSGAEAPNVRWEYLQRMFPNARVDQFVAAYVPYCDHRCNKTPLTRLEPEFQFDVLTALIGESETLIAQVKKYSNPHSIRSANRDEFISLRFQVDCQRSVDALLRWIGDHDKPSEVINFLRYRIESDGFPLSHLRALAKLTDPAVQALILQSIDQKPSPERRKLLSFLVQSEDASVRQKAQELQSQWERLSAEPFQPRFIPPVEPDREDSVKRPVESA